jgi:hypothetical protein
MEIIEQKIVEIQYTQESPVNNNSSSQQMAALNDFVKEIESKCYSKSEEKTVRSNHNSKE